jgi:hypothetical protein
MTRRANVEGPRPARSASLRSVSSSSSLSRNVISFRECVGRRFSGDGMRRPLMYYIVSYFSESNNRLASICSAGQRFWMAAEPSRI